MPEYAKRICPTCGYQPMDGRDGFHSCQERIQAKEILDALKLDMDALKLEIQEKDP